MAKVETVKVSKNARQGGSRTEKFIHECGGTITMKMIFQNGKLRTQAVCDKCNASAKRPSDMELFKETKILKSEVV